MEININLVIVICLEFLIGFVGAQFGNTYIKLPRSTGSDMNMQNDLTWTDDPIKKCILQNKCGGQSECVPISSCPLIGDLLDSSCFSSDRCFRRLNSLSCGHSSDEDLVCCPPGGDEGVSTPGSAASRDWNQDCGETMVRGVDYDGIGSQPWVARIGFTNQDTGKVRFACSGSIISKSVVLTAAHCALAKPDGYKLTTVLVGEWDTDRSPDCNELFCSGPAQALKVAQVVVHPGYEQKIFRHDIALVMLRENIQFTLTAAPICLNQLAEDLAGRRATLVGWGKLSGQLAPVSRQQRLEVPLLALAACADTFGAAAPVREGQLCAGGEAGRDACSGFGGAPLLVRRAGRHYQVGIVSFGSENCGSAGVPSVYTNVAHYYRWIQENSQL